MVCKDNSIDMQLLEAIANFLLEAVHKVCAMSSVIPRLDQSTTHRGNPVLLIGSVPKAFGTGQTGG